MAILRVMSSTANLPDPWAPAVPPSMAELPYDDGEPMESEKHRDQMYLLVESLRLHLGEDPSVFVGGNMGIYYTTLQAVKNEFRAPDFFVVLDAQPRAEPRLSWVVWEEERAPDLVIELLSPGTEATDRGRKMTIYARALKVQEYYLFDPHDLRLEAYVLVDGKYEARPSLPDGSVAADGLGLRLRVAEGRYGNRVDRWLRWALPDGTLLPTGQELAQAERQRAETERQRAETERLRADAERQRAEAERLRADRLAAKLRAAGIEPE